MTRLTDEAVKAGRYLCECTGCHIESIEVPFTVHHEDNGHPWFTTCGTWEPVELDAPCEGTP